MKSDDVIGLASESSNLLSFQALLVRVLQAEIDCEGVLADLSPRPQLPSAVGLRFDALPPSALSSRAWQTYCAEVAPVRDFAFAHQGVAADVDVLPQSVIERSSYYRDLVLPLRGTARLFTCLRLGESVVGRVVFGRSGRMFSKVAIKHVESLLPAISISARALQANPIIQKSNSQKALTSREREVLDLVRLGYRNADIANALETSPNTVRNQLAAIFRKLGAANRAEAIAVAETSPR